MLLTTLLMLAIAPVASLQKALDSSARWTMERKVAGSDRTLVSTGTVDCRAGRGILWSVQTPFESSVEMTTNSMVFADEDGRRVKPLDELPHYADIRRATDAFVAGDVKAFDGVFSLDMRQFPDGGWVAAFTPEISAMRRLFTSIEVAGAERPTNVVMRTADGGVSTIRFRETPRAR